MTDRAFPVIFAQRPSVTADFYERLGFVRHVQLPADGEPGYIGLRRGGYELAVVDMSWPADQYSGTVSAGMRFEMFVYVDDVDAAIKDLGGNNIVLREPADMPWGERVAYVNDPDDNPVALAAATSQVPSQGQDLPGRPG
jgi:lactoylglutathione lyase